MIVKIGIQTRSLRQPIRQAILTAARLGASGIEIDARSELRPTELSRTGLREFHKLLDDHDLRVSALAFPTRRGYEVADDLERRVVATQQAMRFAGELRTDVIINRVGRIPEKSDDPAFQHLTQALTALGAYGDRVGVRFAAQTADTTPQDLERLIKMLPEQFLGIDLQPSGLVAAGHSPVEAVELLGQHIVHIHACDAVRDPATRRTIEVELGRGSADFPELLGMLTEYNFRGWTTIERRESANPIPEIENAVVYLRNL